MKRVYTTEEEVDVLIEEIEQLGGQICGVFECENNVIEIEYWEAV